MGKGESFEQQIERVFKALEKEQTEVAWNARLVDPDTGDLRQIDVLLIRPNGQKVHVECRNRDRKQDVQWIESLFGRKASLGADTVIAVSASGFTPNAIKKAAALSIPCYWLSALNKNNIGIALNPPKVFLRRAKDISIEILITSDGLSKSEVDAAVNGAVRMQPPRFLERIYEYAADRSPVTNVSIPTSFQFRVPWIDEKADPPLHYSFMVKGTAVWDEMKITPLVFSGVEGGEQRIAALINDAALPSVAAEIIVSDSRLLLQIDFTVEEEWADRTYIPQILMLHELARGRKNLFRTRGLPQFQYTFSYTTA